MVAKRQRRVTTPAGDEARPQMPTEPVQRRRRKSQAWFWTPEWKAKGREADDALARGRFRRSLSGADFLAELEAIDAEARIKDAGV